MISSGGSGFTSHRQRSRRTGRFGSLQHPSRVQLCPQPLHQRKRRLKTLALFLFSMQNPENWHQPKVVHVCCAVTVYDVCVFCFFLFFSATLSGVTASLVLQTALEPLPGFSSSLLTLYVPVVLRDGASGLTNTGTVTVTICPCLRGGMQTEDRGRQRDRRWERHMVCLPVPSASPSLIFSLVTLLAMLACVTTLLGTVGQFSEVSELL